MELNKRIWEIRPEQQASAIEWGEELGCQLIEEMAELTQVILAKRRYEGKGQPTDKSFTAIEAALYEEFTDVITLMKQYKWLYNLDEDRMLSIEQEKIERTLERF